MAAAAGMALSSVLSGCAIVDEDAPKKEIVIEHTAMQPILAQKKADLYCADFGMKALKIQETPISTDLLVRTRKSTFVCIKPE